MSLPDFQAGKRFRCPLCYTYLEVPMPGSAPLTPANAAIAVSPPPAKAELQTGPPGQEQPPGLPGAKDQDAAVDTGRLDLADWGLACHYLRLVLLLLCILGFLCLLIIPAFFELILPDSLVLLMALLTWGMIFATPVLGLVGSLLCLGIPRAARACRYIAVAVVFDLLPLVLGYFVATDYFSEPEVLLASIAAPAAQFVAWTFFMVFLRELARYLNRDIEAEEALRLLKMWILLITFAALVTGITFRVADLIGYFLVLVIPLALYFFYLLLKFLLDQLGLIGTLRQVIRSRT
jgi:hypothetical protein